MCGILGQINKTKKIDKKIFLNMLATLNKRGPDQEGCFFRKKTAFGHKRLSIIDLSDTGKQPMFNEKKDICIVFNGEIYDYKKNKKSLLGLHTWRSKTDTEVLVHGYEEFGQKIVEKINGMFAFGIYDMRNDIITVARDHFGKKPLYYYLDDSFFCFASEIKAIIKNPYIKKKLNISKKALTKYLFYGYIPSPDSIFDKIKKLEPATTFQFDIKEWKIVNKYQYWNIETVNIDKDFKEEEIINRAEKLIKKSIKKRLVSDVPVGLFLSGGVDSSLLASYLSELSPQIKSFTVCYRDYPNADESKYAQKVAKKLNIKNYLCYFDNDSVEKNFLKMLGYLDEPMADAAIIPLYFVSKFAKNKVSVVLSGDGGDELFGGYTKYKAQKFIEDMSFLKFAAKIGGGLVSKNNQYYKLLKMFEQPFFVRQFVFGSGSFLPEEASALLKNKKIDLIEIFEDAKKYAEKFLNKDILNKSLFLDAKIQLPDWYLVKGDRATMATSLEMRSPLLDKELAEFSFSLSGKWKIKNGEQKYILKKLAEKYIDNDIIYRKKRGFGVPLDSWIRAELKELFEKYLFIENDFFNLEYVKKIYAEHIDEKCDHQFKLLRIFNFNYWYKNFYE